MFHISSHTLFRISSPIACAAAVWLAHGWQSVLATVGFSKSAPVFSGGGIRVVFWGWDTACCLQALYFVASYSLVGYPTSWGWDTVFGREIENAHLVFWFVCRCVSGTSTSCTSIMFPCVLPPNPAVAWYQLEAGSGVQQPGAGSIAQQPATKPGTCSLDAVVEYFVV